MSCCPTEIIQIPGPQGAPGTNGTNGADGANAYTTVLAPAQAVPASAANVTINVGDTRFMVVGEVLFIGGGLGYYQVVSIPSGTSVEIKNLGYSYNQVGGNFSLTAGVTPTGLVGATGATGAAGGAGAAGAAGSNGTNGVNAYTTVVAPLQAVPATNANIQITVVNTSWMVATQMLYIGVAGYYQIVTVDSTTTVTVKNMGYIGNQVGGNFTVNSGVSPAGLIGPTSSVTGIPKNLVYAVEIAATGNNAGYNLNTGVGVWNKRLLTNTSLVDTGTIGATLSAGSVLNLPAGTYRIHARAPAYRVDSHKLRWANTSDSIYIYGPNGYALNTLAVQTDATVEGRFTIAAAKNFELQHAVSFTNAAGDGPGVASSLGTDERYSEIWIEQELP